MIPLELKNLSQWVCTFANEKRPYNALTGAYASCSDPTTWSTYECAKNAVEQGEFDYIGFVFNDNDIVGIDVDDGYDEDGFLNTLSCDIITATHSYCERSRSGRGIHVYVKGSLPFKGRNNRNGVEIYKTGRYFIVTEHTILYSTMIENQEGIDYIVNKYFKEYARENDKAIVSRQYVPIWELPENNRIKLRPVYPRIPNGSRNICLTSLAGMLHNIGYSKANIYEELKYANLTACDPPLDKNEVQTIVNSVTRYKR